MPMTSARRSASATGIAALVYANSYVKYVLSQLNLQPNL